MRRIAGFRPRSKTNRVTARYRIRSVGENSDPSPSLRITDQLNGRAPEGAPRRDLAENVILSGGEGSLDSGRVRRRIGSTPDIAFARCEKTAILRLRSG